MNGWLVVVLFLHSTCTFIERYSVRTCAEAALLSLSISLLGRVFPSALSVVLIGIIDTIDTVSIRPQLKLLKLPDLTNFSIPCFLASRSKSPVGIKFPSGQCPAGA